MLVLIVLYITLIVLLILGAALYFAKSLQLKRSLGNGQFQSQIDFTDRAQIVDSLERQFNNSPSRDV